jgi:hypothetical protein
MKLIFLLIALLLSIDTLAQTEVSADFDGDETPDNARLVLSDTGFRLVCTLSGGSSQPVSTATITAGGQQNSLAGRLNGFVLTCSFI